MSEVECFEKECTEIIVSQIIKNIKIHGENVIFLYQIMNELSHELAKLSVSAHLCPLIL